MTRAPSLFSLFLCQLRGHEIPEEDERELPRDGGFNPHYNHCIRCGVRVLVEPAEDEISAEYYYLTESP